MSDPVEALRAGLQDRYAFERELGRGGMATVYLAQRPPPRPAGGAQGAPPRARRDARPRALPPGDPPRRPAAAPPHPVGLRLGRDRGPALVHHAVRGGREPARPAPAGAAAPGGGRGAAHPRGRAGAGLRPPARRGAPGHQAGEHPAGGRAGAGGGLRDRPGAGRHRGAAHRDRSRRRDPGLHEPGAGGRRQGAGRPDRHLQPGHRALRDARRGDRRSPRPRRRR